jgi:hypothetical protein
VQRPERRSDRRAARCSGRPLVRVFPGGSLLALGLYDGRLVALCLTLNAPLSVLSHCCRGRAFYPADEGTPRRIGKGSRRHPLRSRRRDPPPLQPRRRLAGPADRGGGDELRRHGGTRPRAGHRGPDPDVRRSDRRGWRHLHDISYVILFVSGPGCHPVHDLAGHAVPGHRRPPCGSSIESRARVASIPLIAPSLPVEIAYALRGPRPLRECCAAYSPNRGGRPSGSFFFVAHVA